MSPSPRSHQLMLTIVVILALIYLSAGSGSAQERQEVSIPPVTITAEKISHEALADGTASKAIATGKVVVTISMNGSERIGTARLAVYDYKEGTITLYGRPQITTGIDVITATAEKTWIIIKPSGMEVHGPHKTTIKKGA